MRSVRVRFRTVSSRTLASREQNVSEVVSWRPARLLSPAATAAGALDVPRTAPGALLRRRAALSDPSQIEELAFDDQGAVPARVRGQRHRRPWLPHGLLVRARLRAATGRRPRDPALRRGRLPRARLGQRPLVDEHEGGHTPFCGRHHARCSTPSGRQTVTVLRRGRSARSGQAARQAGLAARAALDLVSAHHRHLADRVARARAAAPTSRRSAGRRTSRASRSRFEARIGGDAGATTSRIEVTLAPRRARCSRDDRYRVVDSEVDRRIVLSDPGIDDYPQRAAVEPGAADPARRATIRLLSRRPA